MRSFLSLSVSCFLTTALVFAQAGAASSGVAPDAPLQKSGNAVSSPAYVLGPEDVLSIRVLNFEEIGDVPYPVDLRGDVSLPRVGRVHAAGLTVEQFETQLVVAFREFLQHPVVNVQVAEFRSQPISVLGAVASPGVHQIRGRRNLLEILSEAAGLKADAGSTVEITRQKAWGPIPLPNNALDASGEFYTAHVGIHSLMTAERPRENIWVMPRDVITVPKAELVYVIGAVKRAGGFALSEKSEISILEALTLADGLERTAGPRKAKILRPDRVSGVRREIPIDIKKLLAGKEPDASLLANDILFIPNSTGKVVSFRALDALVTTGSGLAIYHPY